MDGINIIKISIYKVILFIIVNFNFSFNIRYFLENVICVFFILRLRKYSFLNNFFYPFVEEYKLLTIEVPDIYNTYIKSYFILYF